MYALAAVALRAETRKNAAGRDLECQHCELLSCLAHKGGQSGSRCVAIATTSDLWLDGF
jgi:hypothetical protein